MINLSKLKEIIEQVSVDYNLGEDSGVFINVYEQLVITPAENDYTPIVTIDTFDGKVVHVNGED